MREVIIF